jgi:hypothetical protein
MTDPHDKPLPARLAEALGDAYTIEGEPIEVGSEGLDAAGYDLLALLTGSEGLLAVITALVVWGAITGPLLVAAIGRA